MKTIGNVLAKVFGSDIHGKMAEHLKLHYEWPKIIEESFRDKDCITAKKAADHSRIAYIKNSVLFIETDHQGWMQIFQTVQKRIITLINKKYSDVSINAVAFLLVNDSEQIEAYENNITATDEGVENSGCCDVKKEGYEKIKDEKLKNILMRLEAQINS
ncbi:MAG: DUF721 domain-containing protein [Spirochaetaceae bacterium]|jgi:hypothetical protein|nr:DUF721 domain-containing protein [Spirochaetaceae bacterium]